jgi:hypothetical protein
LPCNEADILLAISAIDRGQIQSINRAATTYNVPQSTLSDRLAGKPARGDCQPNSKKLTKLEEEAIVEHILDLDSRGFPPSLDAVRHMADKLLDERGAGKVGKRWPSNFVKRTDALTTRFNRPYDIQRALCEDREVIEPWFERVERTKARYGILDEDTYNFDEAGFLMGKISTQLVVTSSDRSRRPKAVQPGDREWATVVQAVNAAGWAIPPYIILAATYHLSTWYEENLPRDWKLAVSDNG